MGEALDGVDVLIDYTSATAVKANTLAAIEAGVARRDRQLGPDRRGLRGDRGRRARALGRRGRVRELLPHRRDVPGRRAAGRAPPAAVGDHRLRERGQARRPERDGARAGRAARRGPRPAIGRPIDEIHGPREARGADVAGTQVHSVRVPSFVVSTEVVFGAPDERLTIRHDAGATPAPYVAGTLLAVRRVPGLVGLTRGLDTLLLALTAEHVDVLIVGAGLSGIGAACRLQQRCPGKTFAILEARGAIGGTWDLFRFPGVRSDSDMFTLSYPFRPWSGSQAIADGASILDYIRETAREHGIEQRIRFHHRVVGAEWSSDDARWTVEVERGDTGETVHLTCGFLFTCTGYYRYDEGHTPRAAGPRALRRRDRASAVLDRGHRLRRQARGRHRQRRDRRDADPGARRSAPPTSRCCSARPATSSRCPRSTRSPACSGASCRAGWPIRSCAGRTCC